VLYVGDAFAVMAKLNALLLEKSQSERSQPSVETAAQLA
jgi:hypothetical protein